MDSNQKWNEDKRKLVFKKKFPGLSDSDQALFESVATSKGLDPLSNEIYAVIRGDKMTIQTGIDGFLKLANQTKELDGIDILYFGPDGNGSEVWLDNKKPPTACIAKVYRKGCSRPFTASCRFESYKQTSPIWKNYPEVMIAKCATTLALRRGFADCLSGIASADELDAAGLAHEDAVHQGLPPSEHTPASNPCPLPEPVTNTQPQVCAAPQPEAQPPIAQQPGDPIPDNHRQEIIGLITEMSKSFPKEFKEFLAGFKKKFNTGDASIRDCITENQHADYCRAFTMKMEDGNS